MSLFYVSLCVCVCFFLSKCFIVFECSQNTKMYFSWLLRKLKLKDICFFVILLNICICYFVKRYYVNIYTHTFVCVCVCVYIVPFKFLHFLCVFLFFWGRFENLIYLFLSFTYFSFCSEFFDFDFLLI